MLALLKLIPLRDWLYVAAIALLLAGFGLYTHHERVVGAERVELADAKAARAQQIHNEEVEARAKTLTDTAVAALKRQLAAPPAFDAPHLWVCHDPAHAGQVPADAGARPHSPPEADAPAAGAADHERRDVGAELDKQLADADAEITALQDYIRACQGAELCKK